MNNKYSFCITKKSDVLDLEDENIISDDELIDVDSDDKITIFTYDDGTILQECDFEYGNYALYCDNGDDTLSLLYECEKETDSSNIISIYTKNGIYISVVEADNVEFVRYMDSEKFTKMGSNIPDKNVPKFLNTLKNFKLSNYVALNSIPIDYNDEEFQKLFNRYSMATKYIPASGSIDSILEQINKYIVTRKIR